MEAPRKMAPPVGFPVRGRTGPLRGIGRPPDTTGPTENFEEAPALASHASINTGTKWKFPIISMCFLSMMRYTRDVRAVFG
jgi:hypothetical protein